MENPVSEGEWVVGVNSSRLLASCAIEYRARTEKDWNGTAEDDRVCAEQTNNTLGWMGWWLWVTMWIIMDMPSTAQLFIGIIGTAAAGGGASANVLAWVCEI